MKAVVTQLVFQKAFIIHHCGEVIEIGVMVRGGVLFQPLVELDDLRGWAADGLHDRFTIPHLVITDWKNGSEYDTDAVRGGELRHRDEVIFDRSESSWTSIAGEIICAGEYHNDFRLEGNHVGTKADEHLRRCLAT